MAVQRESMTAERKVELTVVEKAWKKAAVSAEMKVAWKAA